MSWTKQLIMLLMEGHPHEVATNKVHNDRISAEQRNKLSTTGRSEPVPSKEIRERTILLRTGQ